MDSLLGAPINGLFFLLFFFIFLFFILELPSLLIKKKKVTSTSSPAQSLKKLCPHSVSYRKYRIVSCREYRRYRASILSQACEFKCRTYREKANIVRIASKVIIVQVSYCNQCKYRKYHI